MPNEAINSRKNEFFHSFIAVQALLRPPSVTPGLSLCPFSVNEHSGLARQTTGILNS
jgi:hypothetical protein